jgi:P-type Ca2+ transporter type 2C
VGLRGIRSALSGCCGPELGRGLYDNLTRYIRFEMGCMFGFIISFLGASIFNVADGEPLLPLQILWVPSLP